MYLAVSLYIMTYRVTYRALMGSNHLVATHLALIRFAKDIEQKTARWHCKSGKWIRTEHGHATVMVDHLESVTWNAEQKGIRVDICYAPGRTLSRLVLVPDDSSMPATIPHSDQNPRNVSAA